MRPSKPALAPLVAAALLALGAGCGEAPVLAPPIPEGAFDLSAPAQPDCTFFPDSCADGQQCFNRQEGEGTLCGAAGGRGIGEPCDITSPSRTEFCGPNLICISRGGPDPSPFCSALCATDTDCGLETSGRCVSISETLSACAP